MKNTALKPFLALIAILLLFGNKANAQIFAPVKWSFSSERINNDEAVLIFKAKIEDTWHLYGTDIPANPNGSPIPTSITYEPQKTKFQVKGKIIEPKGVTKFDPNFEMNLKLIDKVAIFKQKVKILSDDAFDIKGFVEYMSCNDSRCLPPTQEPFTIKIDKKTEDTNSVKETSSKAVVATDTASTKDAVKVVQPDSIPKAVQSEKKEEKRTGILWVFIMGFLGGLLAFITPCVFPMVPMTVSFFLKSSKKRKHAIRDALIYGISIVVIYVILGLGITIIFGANALNAMSTNPIFNVFFFLLLVVFAFSFLGAFELRMPSKWTNTLDSKADKTSGFISIFFMAFTLVLVSFSCTGPIIGTLLVETAVTGNKLSPLLGMLGFSIALAIPFTLFAVFPSWLKSMPKSGGWLNTVKVFLGFLELALAFKFLSIADLVLQLHFLEREVFIAIWIAIFGTLALYLFGTFKLPHDSPLSHLSVGRLSLGIFILTFTIYMIPGLWGAPLKIISAFPPPMEYSESPFGIGGMAGSIPTATLPDGAKYGTHGLIVFNDYNKGLAYAKKENKPAMLDFTGLGCVNCRKMEADVWADSRVLDILKKDYVVISLYVDDRAPLPVSEQYVSTLGGTERKIKTVGNKWSDFQASKYGNNSQPFYVLVNGDGKQLIEQTFAFNNNVEAFVIFLEAGKSKMK